MKDLCINDENNNNKYLISQKGDQEGWDAFRLAIFWSWVSLFGSECDI